MDTPSRDSRITMMRSFITNRAGTLVLPLALWFFSPRAVSAADFYVAPTRFHEKNGEGWFRVDLRSGWIQQAEVLFIKPK